MFLILYSQREDTSESSSIDVTSSAEETEIECASPTVVVRPKPIVVRIQLSTKTINFQIPI